MTQTLKRKVEGALIVALIVITTLVAMNATISWGTCAWYGSQTYRDTRYAFGVGCMVKVGTHWVPRNELRTTQ